MKYSFMSFSCPELTLGEMLSLAKGFGYDGIEPRAGSGHKHGVELDTDADARKTIRQQAEDAGVALGCVATSCKYADPKTLDEQIAQTRLYIDLAADVGAPRLRVFGGLLGENVTREQATEQIAHALRSVADHATERGVAVCMETHDDWCNPNHVAEVIKRVDKPSIAVNWDIMHPIRRGGATMEGAYQTLKPWIKHVHFHDGVVHGDKTELAPIGDGIIDHRCAVRLLKADGYDGFLSGEWINWSDAYDIHLPRELATMKQYESEA
ncbi:MAG: sugar phosphate isomerase/epimerase family protein [Planctomycetota bacterium]|nr:sugar phosphate isomerase/epimerase family protein [Planctomycetota bacterium]